MEWTDERIETLKTLWTQGNSASEVSRHLGVTRNAVIGKVHRLGLGRRQAPAPRAIAVQTSRRARAHSGWTGAPAPLPSPLFRLKRAEPRPYRVEPSDIAPTASVLTLHAHSCRWPIGHPDHPEFGFCGRERQANVSYCDHHRKVAFRRSSFSPAEMKRLAGIQ